MFSELRGRIHEHVSKKSQGLGVRGQPSSDHEAMILSGGFAAAKGQQKDLSALWIEHRTCGIRIDVFSNASDRRSPTELSRLR